MGKLSTNWATQAFQPAYPYAKSITTGSGFVTNSAPFSITFSPQQTFATGDGASSVALADLNGDGTLDIITSNQLSNNVSVLLGNGNGSFQTKADFATGLKPRTVTLGDVNGDGKLDIITANRDSDNTSVLLGNGDGTFQTQATFSAGISPRSVTLGDVNTDGKLDIITANRNSNNTSVLLGNGDGTFQPKSDFSTGSQPQSVTIGDVNGDGKLDIITANFDGNSVSVLLGNGNGSFQTKADFATEINPRSVSLGDVNIDGKLDIITANNGSDTASVLLGNGNGTFQTQATFALGSSPSSVTLGDVNGDGRLDITTANYISDNVSVLLGNGNGTFQTKVDFATDDGAISVALGDVNGDGRLDITTANYISDNVSVLLNSLAFTPTPTPTPTPTDNGRRRFPFIPGGSEPVTPADQAPGATDLQPIDLDGDGFRENKQARDGLLVDANRDGIADFLQTEVIAIRLLNDGASASDYGALLPAPGVKVSELTFTAPSADGTLPVTTRSGATLNAAIPTDITNALGGALSFDVSGVAPGGSTQLTLALPAGLQPTTSNAYLRFNYATNRFEDYLDSQGNPLYSFLDTDRDGNVDAIKLTLIDGDPAWDRDGQANGTIVDPGFPATGERNLVGTNRKDSLIGNALANTINGKNNDDVLVGDLGPDLLIGAAGKDRYLYTRSDESTPAQRDTVKLDPDDRFVFSFFDGDITTDGLQTLRFIGKQTFSGVAGELRATRSLLEADLNGDALADFAVNLRGSGLITSNSIVL
jgi:hypothetical protein